MCAGQWVAARLWGLRSPGGSRQSTGAGFGLLPIASRAARIRSFLRPHSFQGCFDESLEFGELVPLLARFSRTSSSESCVTCYEDRHEPSDEDPDSSRARNIQFELWFAGIFSGGLDPDVGESPDVICRPQPPWQFFIECKRVFSGPKKVDERIKEAAEQLRVSFLRDALPTTRGAIAYLFVPGDEPRRGSLPDPRRPGWESGAGGLARRRQWRGRARGATTCLPEDE